MTPELLEQRLTGISLDGCAVLLHTGGDATFGTPAYAEQAPFLTGAGAAWLADWGAALAGIDAVNIDALEAPAWHQIGTWP